MIEVFTGFGEKGVSAETVAKGAVDRARIYLASNAAVGPYLTDQLLLPMTLAGRGEFTTLPVTKHFCFPRRNYQRVSWSRFVGNTSCECRSLAFFGILRDRQRANLRIRLACRVPWPAPMV